MGAYLDRITDLLARIEREEAGSLSSASDAVAEGVDRLAAWTYRGGYGTVVGAPDALKLWDTIGENYKRVIRGRG